MKRILRAILILLLLGGATFLAFYYRLGPFKGNDVRNDAAQTASGRTWAQPLARPGLPNLHRVSDELYRGAQPTAEGLAELHKLGVKTIISLCKEDDRGLAGSGDFKRVHIPLSALNAPDDAQVRQFLDAMSDPANLPAFVHCREGADRTGTMCAVYRIVRQDWDPKSALDEMMYGGFNFHWEFRNLTHYIQNTDFGRFKGPTKMQAAAEAASRSANRVETSN